MRGDATVVEYLNKSLRHELTAVNQYWLHYRLLENWGYKTLAKIWQEALGQKQIGLDDNFFELGGHSLVATSILSRVRSAFNIGLPLRVIFEEHLIRIVERDNKRLTFRHRTFRLTPIRSSPLLPCMVLSDRRSTTARPIHRSGSLARTCPDLTHTKTFLSRNAAVPWPGEPDRDET